MTQPFDLPFPLEEYRGRLRKAQSEMASRGLDLLMVHAPENSYYLSGYRTIGYYSYMALLVPPEGDPVHLTRFIEKSVLQGSSWVPDVETYPDTEHYLDATVRVLRERGWDRGRIGIDKSAWYFTIADYEALRERLPRVEWADTALLIETLRLVKSPAEQEYSRRAGKAASAGMRSALAALRGGVTEDDLMAAAYQGLFRKGSEYPGLPPLINAGVRHTMAHAMAEGNPVRAGEAVYFEVGASVKRYHAATMRIGFIGNPPRLFSDLFDLCRRSMDAALARMRPDVPAENVDRAARQVIDDAGYGDKFRHKAGYSIGIALPPDWSEARTMMLRGGEKRALQPGMVFHILPAVFEYREYGVGLSETVLITEDGHEVLTDCEPELHVVK
ncbi:MAG: aminopeptidase P family protein [Candidatus Tectomicrobia bacterium]|nr:aminopeptidase P family protein [Candidatus Tectomicrobia bacterium]